MKRRIRVRLRLGGAPGCRCVEGSVAVAPLFLQCQLVFQAETANSVMPAQANTKASLVRGLTPIK